MVRVRKTSSKPLLVPELAGESELLWLVEFAPDAPLDGADGRQGQLTRDARALGWTLRLSGGDSLAGLYRQVATCLTSGSNWGTGGATGV